MKAVRLENTQRKRFFDMRGEKPIVSGKNYGTLKGKELEQNRIIYEKYCIKCGFKFEAIATAKYCSESCKQKAKRDRAKAKPKVFKQIELF